MRTKPALLCALSAVPAALFSIFLFNLLPENLLRNNLLAKKTHPALALLPKQILWAWQRPEDLRFLTTNTGVAYIATNITLENNLASIQPRTYPLFVNINTPTVPVVHVDASWRSPPTLNANQQQFIVNALLDAAKHSNSNVIQLDFEVRRSQQLFLRQVVSITRKALPEPIALSVTALASWCNEDWLANLAADEIVPMVFRMAAGDSHIRRQLANDGHFKPQYCQTAVGTATDEPSIRVEAQIKFEDDANVRHYYFSPTSWTKQQWQSTYP